MTHFKFPDTMVKVSRQKFQEAKLRWVSVRGNGSFHRYLGTNKLCSKQRRYYFMTEEAAHKIDMLLSPHWYALLKIQKIQSMETSDAKDRHRNTDTSQNQLA